ncbi:RNA polymerase sigma factor [Aliikangiella marina]|uniref:RNA polymerase sigma factor n=1 Tax=Aliikangiella marina TaxID=1712262 RepID=UPI00163D99C2|nr:RNA polymerase sigma factor [Aliikangiella marina]
MSVIELSDRQLVKQFQSGDRKAFEAFIRRYQDRLLRIALVSLYASKDAEDAVQETFLRAYTGLSSFRFGAEPFTWLYRTLKNVSSELNKRHLRHQGGEGGSLNDDNTLGHANALESQWSGQDELGDALASYKMAKQVKNLVDQLPPQQKEIVILRVFEELSVQQTAKILGCREGTVKANLHKAMNNLRQLSQK